MPARIPISLSPDCWPRRISASVTSWSLPSPLEGYGYDPSKADKLPGDLASALDAFEADADMAGILGERFVETFLTYKRNELERFHQWVTDWEFREYAYHL